MKIYKQFYFIPLLIIVLSQQIYSQNADSSGLEQKIEALKLTEIPIEVERSTSLIALEESKLKESKNIEEIKQRFENLNSNFNT